jgi:hypothetical protein
MEFWNNGMMVFKGDTLLFLQPNMDGLVKSRYSRFFVIPAKAGIQFFQYVPTSLDTGFHR